MLAIDYAKQGYILRSGNAEGADAFFQEGANSVSPSSVELYLPWANYNSRRIHINNRIYFEFKNDEQKKDVFDICEKHHFCWAETSPAAKLFAARCVQIILGRDLDDPVDFVECYTDHPRGAGGTALSLRVALAYNIPATNHWEILKDE
jgi:hypothetical protein